MRKHILYYIGLIFFITLSVALILSYNNQKQMQINIVIALGALYVGWGVMHHMLHHSLRLRIVLEYIAVAALGVAAIILILNSVL